MKNSIGTSVVLTLAGESHGPELCAILDGLAPGIPVDTAFIERLFGTASFYLTRLVKALEEFLHIADEVGEQLTFSTAEVDSLIEDQLKRNYEGKHFRYLQRWEKEKLVQTLANQYRIPPATLAERLDLPVYLVGQMIRSKRNR